MLAHNSKHSKQKHIRKGESKYCKSKTFKYKTDNKILNNSYKIKIKTI